MVHAQPPVYVSPLQTAGHQSHKLWLCFLKLAPDCAADTAVVVAAGVVTTVWMVLPLPGCFDKSAVGPTGLVG